MDYSAANHALWNVIIQMGYIAAVILIAICLRQTIKPIRKTMLPVAVLGGFILLIAKEIGLVDTKTESAERQGQGDESRGKREPSEWSWEGQREHLRGEGI